MQDQLRTKKKHQSKQAMPQPPIKRHPITRFCLALLCMAIFSNACLVANPSELDSSADPLGLLLNYVLKSSGVARLLVSMGDAGAFYTSTDGTVWESRATGSDLIYAGLLYEGGVLFGGQASGTTAFIGAWSEFFSDGNLLTQSITTACTTNADIMDFAYNGSVFVGVGSESTGSAPCTQIATLGGTGFDKGTASAGTGFQTVVFDSTNNEFVAFTMGSAQIEAHTMDPSSTTFSIAASNPNPFGVGGGAFSMGDAIAIDGRVIAVGNDPTGNATSAVAANVGSGAWVSNSTAIFNAQADVPRALAYNGSILVAVGDNCRFDRTTDTTNLDWLAAPLVVQGCSGVNWEDVVWTGKYFVAVGQSGGNAYIAYTETAASADAWTFTQINTGGGGLRSVVAIF